MNATQGNQSVPLPVLLLFYLQSVAHVSSPAPRNTTHMWRKGTKAFKWTFVASKTQASSPAHYRDYDVLPRPSPPPRQYPHHPLTNHSVIHNTKTQHQEKDPVSLRWMESEPLRIQLRHEGLWTQGPFQNSATSHKEFTITHNAIFIHLLIGTQALISHSSTHHQPLTQSLIDTHPLTNQLLSSHTDTHHSPGTGQPPSSPGSPPSPLWWWLPPLRRPSPPALWWWWGWHLVVMVTP